MLLYVISLCDNYHSNVDDDYYYYDDDDDDDDQYTRIQTDAFVKSESESGLNNFRVLCTYLPILLTSSMLITNITTYTSERSYVAKGIYS